MTAGTVRPGAAARFDRAVLWTSVAIGVSLPISTALDGLLVATLFVCWFAGGRWREKLAIVRRNAFALFPCALFLLQLAGSVYSIGELKDVWYALTKAVPLLLIPLLVSLQPGEAWRARALKGFAAAMLLTLALSFLVWWRLLPEGGFIKGAPYDAVVFKLRVTHSVFMAFAAYLFALGARDAPHRQLRYQMALLAALAVFNVFFMVQGRTGQVVLMALLLYFMITSFRWQGIVAAAAMSILVGGATYFTPSSSLHQRTQTTIREFSDWRAGKPAQLANMRLETWSNSLEVIRQYPVLGSGTGGFAAAYARQVEGTSMRTAPQPENQYLLTAVQLGAFGLATLLALFAAQWRLAARLATRTETDIARGLVIFMVVGCLFNSFLLDHTEALFYAWLSGLLFAGLRPKDAGERR